MEEAFLCTAGDIVWKRREKLFGNFAIKCPLKAHDLSSSNKKMHKKKKYIWIKCLQKELLILYLVYLEGVHVYAELKTIHIIQWK